jgi:FkbM family methyltransferase
VAGFKWLLDAFVKWCRFLFRGTRIQRSPLANWAYSSYVKMRLGGYKSDAGTVIVSFQGNSIEIEGADITILPTLVTGEYEVRELRNFQNVIPKFGTFIDVGANVGIYSVLALSTNPAIKVLAFEPVEFTANVFYRNIERNFRGKRTDVTLVRSAVSDSVGEVPWVSTKFYGTNHLGSPNLVDRNQSRDRVQTTMLDFFLKDEFEIKGPVFVKVDVEGFEPDVIVGASELIYSKRPTLQLEICKSEGQQSKWDSVVNFLSQQFKEIQVFGPRGTEYVTQDVKGTIINLSADSRLHNVVLWPERVGVV